VTKVQWGHVAMLGRIPGHWYFTRGKNAGRNVSGPRGPWCQLLVISRGAPYPTSW